MAETKGKIFSGESSKEFWAAINLSKQNILYDYGCKAQELEASHDDLLAACEDYIEHFDSDESDLQMKQWLDLEGIPAIRTAISKAQSKTSVQPIKSTGRK